jgi:hypothetical protein
LAFEFEPTLLYNYYYLFSVQVNFHLLLFFFILFFLQTLARFPVCEGDTASVSHQPLLSRSDQSHALRTTTSLLDNSLLDIQQTISIALLLIARLTRVHAYALEFVQAGGLSRLLRLQSQTYDLNAPAHTAHISLLVAYIVRNVMESDKVLQGMVSDQLKALIAPSQPSGTNPALSVKDLLKQLAPAAARSPSALCEAVVMSCQLVSSSSNRIVLKKELKDGSTTTTAAEPIASAPVSSSSSDFVDPIVDGVAKSTLTVIEAVAAPIFEYATRYPILLGS